MQSTHNSKKTRTMTNEELLAQRVMVIAVWPKCPYKVGDILRYTDEIWVFNEYEYKEDAYRIFLKGISGYFLNENTECIGESEISMYPHILRIMHWSEGREIADLPEYIKFQISKAFKVRWEREDGRREGIICKDANGDWWDDMYKSFKYAEAIPATKEEYEAYLTKSK